MATETDVIVIGSGFGGAIPASHIVEAGFKVNILEPGPCRTRISFACQVG
ncbi:MAG: hypothetical protein JKX92_02785 [Porticoccaceae bacterium]|nr:hypothetical protein [Porticoccaceae bacterium]